MTESEWLTCNDPERMLNHLLGRRSVGALRAWLGLRRKGSATRSHCASDRKLRLFAVGCCRRIWFLLQDSRSQRAVETSERYADGLANEEELLASRLEAGAATDSLQTAPATEYMVVALGMGSGGSGKAWPWAARAAAEAASPDAAAAAVATLSAVKRAALEVAMMWQDPKQAAKVAGEGTLAGLVRDLCGPLPFRPVPINLSWLAWNNGAVPKLARSIYDGRAFDRLPVLADALEEAGYNDPDVLAHCRSGGEHAQGCWVVDRVLGKG